MSSERSVKDLSGPYTKRLVGANGFEPSTSWSRTRHLNPINALSGVAYGPRSVISPLLVVPNLYLARHSAIQTLGRPDSESPSTVRMLSEKRKKSNWLRGISADPPGPGATCYRPICLSRLIHRSCSGARRPIFLPSPPMAAATCQSLKMRAGQLAAKEVTTYAVEMLARRPEKGGRREFLVRCGWLLSSLLPRLNHTGVFASVLLVCREGADVSFARTEKIQKIQPGVFTRLAHTQQDDVFFNPLRRRKTFYVT